MNQIGTMDEQAKFVKRKYERMGYRVHSGLQFGADLVLYAHRPDLVHSDFCINISSDDEMIDFREMQSLVRSMPDLHKTLVLANVKTSNGTDFDSNGTHQVDELVVTTEHAPFRHRPKQVEIGAQKKNKRGRG